MNPAILAHLLALMMGLSAIVGIMFTTLVPELPGPDLVTDTILVDNDEFNISFTYDDPGILLTLTADGKMEIGHPPIAIVDLETGHVFLRGDPDEAARLFWEAVELMRQ